MTVAGSTLKCCNRAAMDIGGSRVCERGQRESALDSKSGAVPRPEQRSNCTFQAILPFRTNLLNAPWDGLPDCTLEKQKRENCRGRKTRRKMSDKNRIRVFSVDDHPLLREGIAAIINNQPDMLMVA